MDNTLQYQIVKIGQGKNKPQKYKECSNCGRSINDFRIELHVENDKKEYFCLHCIFQDFIDKQKQNNKWYKKILNLFFIVKNCCFKLFNRKEYTT